VRRAGATPKVKTSASESYSRPNSLSVPVRRAIRPSMASRIAAAKTRAAAIWKPERRSAGCGSCGTIPAERKPRTMA